MMVARNFSVQDISTTGLLQEPDNENGFITLQELKPVRGQPNLEAYQRNNYYELTQIITDPCSSNQSYQSNQNLSSTQDDSSSSSNKKRKPYLDIDGKDKTEDGRFMGANDENKKQNHSEVEKRRRDKMNTYITELSSMVPMCHAMSRKLDKLTVLRLAVQHMKSIRGALPSYTEGNYKPSLLSDQELKHVILQAAEGFLFVVGCDRGRILYVSQSVSKVLNYSQGDLLGQSLFDILHPKDVAKVKEQLSSSDISPRERLIDAKTMLPVKTDFPQGTSRLCSGARRSFFCRMKCNLSVQVKEEADTTTGYHRRKKYNSDKKYNVIQCTGYLKSWPPAKIGLEEQEDVDGDSCNLSCLVAIGRILPHISTVAAHCQGRANVKQIQFTSRHGLDGKFLFIDQRSTLVLGFLPQELLGTSMYEYFHHEDLQSLSEYHKLTLQSTNPVTTNVYRFRTKSGGFIKIQSEWKSFKNPWTKEIENFNSKNNLILTDFRTVESSATQSDGIQESIDLFSQYNGKDMHLLINNHLEVSKIGRQIADQVMDSQRRSGDSSSESSPDPETTFLVPTATGDTPNPPIHSNDLTDYTNDPKYYDVRNMTLNNVATDPGGTTDEGIIELMEEENVITERTNPPPSVDGNDEAAMAVIMSLLEADAGLGGPVDFSGLPWPLP